MLTINDQPELSTKMQFKIMKSSIKLSRWIAFACFLAAGFTSDYANSQSGNQTAQQEAVANQVDDSLLADRAEQSVQPAI